jgi:hypothetical protein
VKVGGSCTREADLDRTRPSPSPAAVGFGGRVWARQGADSSPVEGPMLGALQDARQFSGWRQGVLTGLGHGQLLHPAGGCGRSRCTAASSDDRQHTQLAGTMAKRPAAPLVRDEEAAHGHAGKPQIVAQDRLHAATAFGAGTQAAYGLPAGPAARR